MGGRGSGGRNRKPTKLKQVEGNPGKRALNRAEPKPLKGVPDIPARLSARARAHWQRLIPLLQGMRVLTVADGDALAGYCSVLVQWELAATAIEKYGIIITEPDYLLPDAPGALPIPTGAVNLRVNPAVRVQSDALRQMRSFENEFGLTPASRSKVKVTQDGEARDPLEDLLSGKTVNDIVQ